ncbi:MAG: hypothetical protein K2K91_04375 [Ruminococcus sp.]|nr:hypothetical protein [Ruminococcus sp.]
MSEEFKIIETQEAFDEAIKGYITPDEASKLNEKISVQEKEIADLKSKNLSHERSLLRSKIAYETGLPYELSERLSGETESEIRADAEKLSGYIKTANNTHQPKFSAETHSENNGKSAFLEMLHELNN